MEKYDKLATRLIRMLANHEVAKVDYLAKRIFGNDQGRAIEEVEAIIGEICGRTDKPKSIEFEGRRFKIVYENMVAKVRPPQNILLNYFSKPKSLCSIEANGEEDDEDYRRSDWYNEPKNLAEIIREVYEDWEIERGLNILLERGQIHEVHDLEKERNPCFATSYFVLPFSLHYFKNEPALKWGEVAIATNGKIKTDTKIKGRPSKREIIDVRYDSEIPTRGELKTLMTLMKIEDMHARRTERNNIVYESIPSWTLRAALLHYISEGNTLDGISGGFIGWERNELSSDIKAAIEDMTHSRYITGGPKKPQITTFGGKVLEDFLQNWYDGVPKQFKSVFKDFISLPKQRGF